MERITRWAKETLARPFLGEANGKLTPELADSLNQLAEWLLASRHTVALTGAGISTGSGIPDFRSPQSGLWLQADPMQVASIWGFRDDPAAFYKWIRPLAQKMRIARPNSAHKALVDLEAHHLLHTIVTQNIDDLHRSAGSERVLHVHGLAERAVCMGCDEVWFDADFWQTLLSESTEHLPICTSCAGVMKPDVILFGEDLPYEVIHAAQQAALNCDLMIVAGSSLEVMPAADLPLLAQRRGAKLAIINLGQTAIDHRADLVIHADVLYALPLLAQIAIQAQTH